MSVRRLSSIATALAGAVCFALAVQGGRWWKIGEIGIGPVSTQSCFAGDCAPGTLTWAGGTDMWERAGVATYVGGLCAAAVLLALAGALAAGRTARLAAAVAAVATITAVGAGALFVMARPDLPGSVAGRGLFLFGGAVVAAGIAVAITLLRRPA
ncbi:MAG TPA: hypothetical protein VM734_30170 [Kofleriaceae bacterium]|nr:hypothetical protein [Kofleriaceae bacterium]